MRQRRNDLGFGARQFFQSSVDVLRGALLMRELDKQAVMPGL